MFTIKLKSNNLIKTNILKYVHNNLDKNKYCQRNLHNICNTNILDYNKNYMNKLLSNNDFKRHLMVDIESIKVMQNKTHFYHKCKPLDDDTQYLGSILKMSAQKYTDKDIYSKIEVILSLSSSNSIGKMNEFVNKLTNNECLVVSKYFSKYLLLMNASEEAHRIHRIRMFESNSNTLVKNGMRETLLHLQKKYNLNKNLIFEKLRKQSMEMIMTAHPTQINRTIVLSRKETLIKLLLEKKKKLTEYERKEIENKIIREVLVLWNTDDIIRNKPTPMDEAQYALDTVKNTLWDAVPKYMRKLDTDTLDILGEKMPVDSCIIKFGSWMGGDRDGNPNVTSEITKSVILNQKHFAFSMYDKEVEYLINNLTISKEINFGEKIISISPYSDKLKKISLKIKNSIRYIENYSKDLNLFYSERYHTSKHLLNDIMNVYDSMIKEEYVEIANGNLRDLIRRVVCFGINLVPLDLRQDSAKHTEAIDSITKYIGIGSYSSWSESEKIKFLNKELLSKRPLLSNEFIASDNCSKEIGDLLNTFKVTKEFGKEAFGAYIISMAKKPSDILAVKLLQKEFGEGKDSMRIVPLFETLEDLNNSVNTMSNLYSNPLYFEDCNGKQEIMIGYSDSSKDAGKIAASWGLYEAQEKLAELSKTKNIKLSLFHGKGGSVSRGGGTQGCGSFNSILSQPKDTVNGHYRITEQGEVINTNFGNQEIAERTFDIYSSAILTESYVNEKNEKIVPTTKWRKIMNRLSKTSREKYREIVFKDSRFIPYFRESTVETELSGLNIGSRPARRPSGKDDGVESLRAIPWVFAWTQTRLLLPTWLGVGDAISEILNTDDEKELKMMYKEWPYFRQNLELIDKELDQADTEINKFYDDKLVHDVELKELGNTLRYKLNETKEAMNELRGKKDEFDCKDDILFRMVNTRKLLIDPLNLVQCEILRRKRNVDDCNTWDKKNQKYIQDTLLLTMNGIANGLKVTG